MGRGQLEIRDSGRDFGQNLGILDEILWVKDGEIGEMLDPLETKHIYGSNPTKLHHTNKSQNKIGAIFGGDFRN